MTSLHVICGLPPNQKSWLRLCLEVILYASDRPNKCRYLCCTKIRENTNIIVVVAYSISLFLMKLNFRTQIAMFLSLYYPEV